MLHPKLQALERRLKPSILTQIFDPLLEQKQIELWLKRDDLIHSVISGNKWRKLKYILDHALSLNAQTIISMGGAYSNHLHALAFVGKQLNLQTIGYIRGERPKQFSATLSDLERWGMELRFVSRSDYRVLRQYKDYNALPDMRKEEYWLPEGGATKLALQGVAEMLMEIDIKYDCLCVPCGTGTTMAGLINASLNDRHIYGFSALKGAGFLLKDIEPLLTVNNSNWSIQLAYHFGGFAKANTELLLFIEHFFNQHGIELEQVYTGKMLYGIFDLIKQDFFKSGRVIIAVHTGGLQGKKR